jgi:hypothetical protein
LNNNNNNNNNNFCNTKLMSQAYKYPCGGGGGDENMPNQTLLKCRE